MDGLGCQLLRLDLAIVLKVIVQVLNFILRNFGLQLNVVVALKSLVLRITQFHCILASKRRRFALVTNKDERSCHA